MARPVGDYGQAAWRPRRHDFWIPRRRRQELRVVQPTPEALDEAASLILSGGLVVMPTETVYGLACLATNLEAVEKVFAAKGRPPESPLIVHVSGIEQARVIADVNQQAEILIARFWPGPLTLVLPKRDAVPSRVTAGLDTVAIRMPNHPVALALIGRAGPLAAPSANRFTKLSPTRAEDVDPTLGDLLVIDGGPCQVGIESTVIDLTGPPRVLRPGQVSVVELTAALGTAVEVGATTGPQRSPGLHERHYSPTTPVRLTDRLSSGEAGLTFEEPENPGQIRVSRDPAVYAAMLYFSLADLDRRGVEEIVIEGPPETPEWLAVWDRLRRCSS